MNLLSLRFAALLSFVLLLVSCARVYVPSSSPGNSTYGHCQAKKHSCEKYEKEKGKKHPNANKIAAYHDDCLAYNQNCR